MVDDLELKSLKYTAPYVSLPGIAWPVNITVTLTSAPRHKFGLRSRFDSIGSGKGVDDVRSFDSGDSLNLYCHCMFSARGRTAARSLSIPFHQLGVATPASCPREAAYGAGL